MEVKATGFAAYVTFILIIYGLVSVVMDIIGALT